MLLILSLLMLPLLSVNGVTMMNVFGNNSILMLMLILIAAQVSIITLLSKSIPDSVYPLAILMISISTLFMLSLRSSHILGQDLHAEFYFFQLTKSRSYWASSIPNVYNAHLSITILPTVFVLVSGMNDEYIFKVVYPLIFSLVPVIMYNIYKRPIGKLGAFLASIFFISHNIFIYITCLLKQLTAVFFLAIALQILFGEKINTMKGRLFFLLFGFCMILSHYATAYTYIFLLSPAWLLLYALDRYKSKIQEFNITDKRATTLTAILLLFFTAFFWYGQVTKVPFANVVNFTESTFRSLGEAFVEESRSGVVYESVGKTGSELLRIHSLIGSIGRFFIFLGAVHIVKKYKNTTFKVEYGALSLSCLSILLASVALPYFTRMYNLDRVYLVTLVLLSPLFVVGGCTAFRYLHLPSKRNVNYVLLLLILLAQFSFATGLTYQLFGSRESVSLNNEGTFYDSLYIHDQEVAGAKWLLGVNNGRVVYADLFGKHRLRSYFGMINPPGLPESPSGLSEISGGAFIYLRYLNVVSNKMMMYDKFGELSINDMTEVFSILNHKNRIYSNGGATIYNWD